MQKINLVKSLPPRENFFLTARLAELIVASVTSLFILILVIMFAVNLFKAFSLSSLKKNKLMMQNELLNIADQKPQNEKEKVIIERIKNLDNKIKDKKIIFEFFKAQKKELFTQYLSLLSEKVPQNLWLTSFSIDPSKNKFYATGLSLSAPNVLNFAQDLDNSKLLSSYNLVVDDLKKVKENEYGFIINSSANSKKIEKQSSTNEKKK